MTLYISSHPAPKPIVIWREGFECQAISSGRQLLSHFHVPYILMEWGKMFKPRHRISSPCPVGTTRHITDILTRLVRGCWSEDRIRPGSRTQHDQVENWRYWRYWRHRLAPELQTRYWWIYETVLDQCYGFSCTLYTSDWFNMYLVSRQYIHNYFPYYGSCNAPDQLVFKCVHMP